MFQFKVKVKRVWTCFVELTMAIYILRAEMELTRITV